MESLFPYVCWCNLEGDAKVCPGFAEGLVTCSQPANWAQIMVQTGLYGYVLFVAADLIGGGAELLLLCPDWAPIVGSIVLPILGAVPDGMMVLFSGMGKFEDAKSQVAVGMGALAGSSIMLLTMPWFLAVFAGRVSIVDGKPTYCKPAGAAKDWKKLDPPGAKGLFTTGVSVGEEIKNNAKLMICTCSTYVIIQIPAWFQDTVNGKGPGGVGKQDKADYSREGSAEQVWAIVALVACFAWFCYYMWKMHSDGCHDKIVQANVAGIQGGHLTLRGALKNLHESIMPLYGKGGLEEGLLKGNPLAEEEVRRMSRILRPFFKMYDTDGDEQISIDEFRLLMKDLRGNASLEAQSKIFKAADTDNSGDINFEEFLACIIAFALDTPSPDDGTEDKGKAVDEDGEGSDEEDGDEEDDMPEDLADLPAEEQQKRIKNRAFAKMGIGTALVLFFSDPMCDILGTIGDKVGVDKFYVSFLLAPLASNASELVSAIKLAQRRTAKSMVDALSTLEGAAVMNNTFCMSIFLGLVAFRGLAYQFKAETCSIIIIQVMVGLLALKSSTMRLFDALVILMCYPLALVIVYVLENVFHWD